MINLRYHIVSITAVFLALGIGVALGSTLIQRATVEQLEGRLAELDERLDETDGENAELKSEIEALEGFEEEFSAAGVALLSGHLTEVPVVLVTVQGVDDDLVSGTRESLAAAGADVTGVLRFTSRWEELSDDEAAELSALLERRLSTAEVIRSLVLQHVADEMLAASEPEPEPTEPVPTTEASDAAPTPSGAAPDTSAPLEPEGELDPSVDELDPPTPTRGELVAKLLELGYLEFLPANAATPLPTYAARYLFVLEAGSSPLTEQEVLPLLRVLSSVSSAPVVVAESGAAPEGEEGDDDEDGAPFSLVARIREEEALRETLSTVDSLDTFLGRGGVVLALRDAGRGVVGHYGLGAGATALLPSAEGS